MIFQCTVIKFNNHTLQCTLMYKMHFNSKDVNYNIFVTCIISQ